MSGVELEFSGEVWFWRGPAPWYFVSVPEEHVAAVRAEAPEVSYGWGMIPVLARIGGTEWETAMWPKNGSYVLPLKAAIRRAEQLDEGDTPTVHLTV